MSDKITKSKSENLQEFYKFYNKCISERMAEFDRIREQLEHIIEELVATGVIGRKVQILSRIKSPESALRKMLAMIKNKEETGVEIESTRGTYDIYAVSILCETSEELQRIKSVLKEKGLRIEGEKIRKEKRGYNAEHFNFAIDSLEKLKVECHMQTFKEDKEKYPHLYYKVLQALHGGKAKGGKLSAEDELAANQAIIRQYQSGKLIGCRLANGESCRVPQMWEAKLDNNGRMKRRKLSEDEAIRCAYYPALEGIKKVEQLEAR